MKLRIELSADPALLGLLRDIATNLRRLVARTPITDPVQERAADIADSFTARQNRSRFDGERVSVATESALVEAQIKERAREAGLVVPEE